MELAIMLLSAGRDDDALSQVNQILLEQPARTDALRLMAIINFRLDHLDAAWADFQDVLASGHYTMDALYYLGRISDRRSEHDQAVRLYSQVQRGNNAVISQRRASAISDPEARMELAIMLLSAGRDDDALSQVNQILLEQPARTDALRLMAIINFRLDHLDAAWADFQDVLASGHYTMDALYYLGRISDRRSEHDQAVRLYSQVQRGNNAVISQRRASAILAQQGKDDEALEHLRQFGTDNPSYAVDMVEAEAQLLASMERYPDALDAYDRVIKFRPESEAVVLGKAELLIVLRSAFGARSGGSPLFASAKG